MNALFSLPVIHGKKCMTVVFFSKKKTNETGHILT